MPSLLPEYNCTQFAQHRNKGQQHAHTCVQQCDDVWLPCFATCRSAIDGGRQASTGKYLHVLQGPTAKLFSSMHYSKETATSARGEVNCQSSKDTAGLACGSSYYKDAESKAKQDQAYAHLLRLRVIVETCNLLRVHQQTQHNTPWRWSVHHIRERQQQLLTQKWLQESPCSSPMLFEYCGNQRWFLPWSTSNCWAHAQQCCRIM